MKASPVIVAIMVLGGCVPATGKLADSADTATIPSVRWLEHALDPGPDRVAFPGQPVHLQLSTGEPFDRVTWAVRRAPGASAWGLRGLRSPHARSVTFVPDEAGQYTIAVTACASSAWCVDDTVQVYVITDDEDWGHLPVADAGLQGLARSGVPIVLDSSRSGTPVGDPVRALWTIRSAPAGSVVTSANIDDPRAATTRFSADVEGTYIASVVVRSGPWWARDEVELHVGPDDPEPVSVELDAAPGTVSTGQAVLVTADVEEEGSLSYALTRAPAGSALLTDAPQAISLTTASMVLDEDGGYIVRGFLQGPNRINEDRDWSDPEGISPNQTAPLVSILAFPISRLGLPVTLHGDANDPEGDPIKPYWTLVRTPPGSQLTQASLSGTRTLDVLLTPDVPGAYVLKLSCWDGGRIGTATRTVTVVP
ncbi:MAG: hypothetical protein H6739_14090 [Alphaproteobacteria bacterium]|nr:hypothetical protein [Alphaproteobacteria bacterium]